MGFLNRLFGGREVASARNDKGSANLALVLLTEARPPDAEAIVRAFQDFAAPGENLQIASNNSDNDSRKEIISLELNTGEVSFVALMPIAVPNGEADHNAKFSLSAFRKDWKLPPHSSHLVVTFRAGSESTPIDTLSRFTSLLAAVTKASPAIGVYWGSAGATHDSEFFTSVASDQGIVPRIVLWSGVSIGREGDGRLSLLSLGMKQLQLPDLLLVAGKSSEDVALETMFDLLAYVADRGEALPEGDTVGRTAQEQLPVRYVPSPVDPTRKVWRVELP